MMAVGRAYQTIGPIARCFPTFLHIPVFYSCRVLLREVIKDAHGCSWLRAWDLQVLLLPIFHRHVAYVCVTENEPQC